MFSHLPCRQLVILFLHLALYHAYESYAGILMEMKLYLVVEDYQIDLRRELQKGVNQF